MHEYSEANKKSSEFVNSRSLLYLAVKRCRKALSKRGSSTFSSGSQVLYLIGFQRKNRQELQQKKIKQ